MYQIFDKLRKNKGVSVYRVAKETGINQSTFTAWKSGEYVPKHEKLVKIADYFGVSVDYLLTGEKASCNPYTYKQIARNPNQYMGKQAKVTGEVQQVEQADDGSEVILIAITKDSDADAWTNAIYATYTPKSDNESRILENDIITLYGTLDGIEDYTTVMGDTKSVPKLMAEYRDIKN